MENKKNSSPRFLRSRERKGELNTKERSEQHPTIDTSRQRSHLGLPTILGDQNLVGYKPPANNATKKPAKCIKLDPLNIAGNSCPRPSAPMRRPSVHESTSTPRQQRVHQSTSRPRWHCIARDERERLINSYKVVQNIGHAALLQNGKRRTLYKCFVLDCEFMTISENSLTLHLTTMHRNVKWMGGTCQACRVKKVNMKRYQKVRDELHHLKEAHFTIEQLDLKDQPHFAIDDAQIDLTNEESGATAMTSKSGCQTLLRPWMDESNSKSGAIVKRMLQDDCLEANYKCMERACDFFTSDIKLFQQHVNVHFENERAEGHNQCSSCKFVAKDSLSLIEHASVNHWDKLQCKYCFFRSPMGVLASLHVLQCHPDMPRNSKFIGVTPSPYLSWANIEKMVSPLFCSHCDKKFYLVRGFKGHVNTCCKNRNVNCAKCGVVVDKKDVLDHLESCNQVGTFHCLYCRFGTNGIEKLQSHINSQHSGELQLYCMRQSTKFVSV